MECSFIELNLSGKLLGNIKWQNNISEILKALSFKNDKYNSAIMECRQAKFDFSKVKVFLFCKIVLK